MSSIYLDYNATTPADPSVVDCMLPFLREQFGNPQSKFHNYGWEADKAVEKARTHVAKLIGADAKEIFFTGSATESNNWVVMGLISQLRADGDLSTVHMITSPIEHQSVLESFKQAKIFGVEIDFCDIDSDGRVKLESIEKLIRPTTKLISIMWVNNEIGAINPVKEICELAKAKKIYFHSDATQAVSKMNVNVSAVPVDLLTMTAHKMSGPKGVGALYIRSKNPSVSIAPLLHGGGHERGARSGTLNVPGIVGFGEAARIASENLNKNIEHYKTLQNYFWSKIQLNFPRVKRNGPIENSAPNLLSLTFEDYIVPASLAGLAVSRGSACSSGKAYSSHVLKAVGLSDRQADKTLRISFGRETTLSQLDEAILILAKEIKPL